MKPGKEITVKEMVKQYLDEGCDYYTLKIFRNGVIDYNDNLEAYFDAGRADNIHLHDLKVTEYYKYEKKDQVIIYV